jgi:hypothetical protein
VAVMTWALVVLAFIALVSGFFVRTSSVPLLVSCVFSAIVLLLILFGWSRRIRGDALFEEPEPGAELEEVDAEPADDYASVTTGQLPARTRRSRERGRVAATIQLPEIDQDEEIDVDEEIDQDEEIDVDDVVDDRPDEREEFAALDVDDEDEFDIDLFAPPEVKERKARAQRPAKAPAKAKPTAKSTPPARKPKKAPPRKASTARGGSPKRVLVIPGRERYHVRGCRFAKGGDLREVAEATARRRGYVPCSVCTPED